MCKSGTNFCMKEIRGIFVTSNPLLANKDEDEKHVAYGDDMSVVAHVVITDDTYIQLTKG